MLYHIYICNNKFCVGTWLLFHSIQLVSQQHWTPSWLIHKVLGLHHLLVSLLWCVYHRFELKAKIKDGHIFMKRKFHNYLTLLMSTKNLLTQVGFELAPLGTPFRHSTCWAIMDIAFSHHNNIHPVHLNWIKWSHHNDNSAGRVEDRCP